MNQVTSRQLVLKTKSLFRYSPKAAAGREMDTTTSTITITSTTLGNNGVFDMGSWRSKKNSRFPNE